MSYPSYAALRASVAVRLRSAISDSFRISEPSFHELLKTTATSIAFDCRRQDTAMAAVSEATTNRRNKSCRRVLYALLPTPYSLTPTPCSQYAFANHASACAGLSQRMHARAGTVESGILRMVACVSVLMRASQSAAPHQ